jgi:hypothetical protein
MDSPSAGSPSHRALGALLAIVVAVSLAACAGAATFAPDGPCAVDGRAKGAYPDLEKLLPLSLDGAAPNTLDSGRTCSDPALGTLVSHGVHEMRSAGATWDEGGGKATTIAVLSLPGREMPVAWAEEFYEVGARTAKKTEQITTSRPTIAGRTVFRLDTLNDLSFQTVAVWHDGIVARVALVATPVNLSASRAMHDARVEAAIGAAASAPPAPASPAPSGSGG